ncbi:MAG: glycosyltransferase [Rhodopirellula sp.]|nr:glycosyltransferase [Rhodopirellula sp.]
MTTTPTAVALCITELDVGGAEQALVDLVVRLDRSRFEPVVYCLGPQPSPGEPSCLSPLQQAGIPVHCLGARRKRDLLPVYRRLIQELARRRVKLVQCFLFHANLLGRLAARKVGVPRVLSGIRVAERRHRWHLWADRLTSRWVDRYVCVSRSVADFSACEGGLPQSKIVVIPNGIDVAAYPGALPADLRHFGIKPGRRVVTYVGRMEHQKGLDWLIPSVPNWLGPQHDCDLLLVGQGPDLPMLQRAAAATGFADRIHFAGWRKDVPEILAASQMLVLPSRWEGMPNVVLQAMASRMPVVATDVEGVRELLGPNAQEQTVPFGDSRALEERVSAILSDASLAKQLGRVNRTRAAEEFTLARVVSAYQDLWDSLPRSDFAS